MLSSESDSSNVMSVRKLKFADEQGSLSSESEISPLQPVEVVLTDASSLTGTDGETNSKSSDVNASTPSPPTFPTLTFPGSDKELKAAKINGDLAVYFPISFALNSRSVECYFFAFSTALGKSLGPATRFTGYPHAFGKGNSNYCTILAFSFDRIGQIVVNFTLDKLSTADVNKLKVYQDFWTNIVAQANLKIVDEITDYITDTKSLDCAIKHSADILVMKAKAGAIWKIATKSGKADKTSGSRTSDSPTPPMDDNTAAGRSKRNVPLRNYAPTKQSTHFEETSTAVVVKKRSIGGNKRPAPAAKVIPESEKALMLKIKQLENEKVRAQVYADIQSRESKKQSSQASAKPDTGSYNSDDEAVSCTSLVVAKPRGVQSKSGKKGINPTVELAVPVAVPNHNEDYVKRLEERLQAVERNSISSVNNISSSTSSALTVPPSMDVVPHLTAAVGSNTNYTMQTSNLNSFVPGFANSMGTSMGMQQVMGFNNLQTQMQYQQLQNSMQLRHLEDKMTLQQFGNQMAMQQQMNQMAMPCNPPFNFRS